MIILEGLICLTLGIFIVMSVFFIWRNTKWFRNDRGRERRTLKLMHSLYEWSYEDHISRDDFSVLVNGHSKRLSSKILSQMGEFTYGHLPLRIEKLIYWRKIDKMLLRDAKRRSGYQRAKTLKMLYSLPISRKCVAHILPYKNDQNRYVRLYALLIHINSDLNNIVTIVSNFKHTMSNFEFSQIALLLKRRMVATDFYKTLLQANNKQLCLIGLNLIRLMNITQAHKDILRLLPEKDRELRDALLHTLITIHSSLVRENIARSIAKMGIKEKKWFYRLAVSEGYSQQGLSLALDNESDSDFTKYVVCMINGFKHKLI